MSRVRGSPTGAGPTEQNVTKPCEPSARTTTEPRGAQGDPRSQAGAGDEEILVAVHAAGVNPTDWSNRARVTTIARMPIVLGWDVSGVVEAVGMGVTLFKPGDEVFGCEDPERAFDSTSPSRTTG